MQIKVDFQEPDKGKRVKKIIAREGLILLGIMGTGFLLTFIYIPQDRGMIGVIGLFLLHFGCPVYLLVRFIIWAIKTLKNKA